MSHTNNTTSKRGLSIENLRGQKIISLRLADHLHTIFRETNVDRYFAASDRVKNCSTVWAAMYCPTCKVYHQATTYGCHHRLCPICATRQARVTAYQAMDAVNLINTMHDDDLCYTLVTLTQRNINAASLDGEIDKLLDAWKSIRYLREFRRTSLGWARTIEIVPQKDNGRMYHPHIHIIMIHKSRADSIASADWWCAAWRAVMELDYNPIVDARPIDDQMGAVYEVSKYVSKLSRIYDGSPMELQHVKVLGDAIYNRRLRSYGGEWSKARRMLNQSPAELLSDDDLMKAEEREHHLSGSCKNCGTGLQFATLYWSGLDYVT